MPLTESDLMSDSLTEQQWMEIEDYLYNGRKIEAIKIFREYTGLGLKDAKEVLDQHETELRKKRPDRFKKSGGCGTVVAVILVGVLSIVAAL